MKALFTTGRRALAALLLLSLFVAPSARSEDGVPEKLDAPVAATPFTVFLTDAAGAERDLFSHRNPPVFDIHFTLALSASDKYPLSLYLIQDSEKVRIFKGVLSEGFYRLRYPLAKLPKSGGEVAARVVLKTRIFKARYSSESTYNYQKWEGTYRTGNR